MPESFANPKPGNLEPVVGYVWCDLHGCVHEDELNPYDYPDAGDWCEKQNHRPLFVPAAPEGEE